MDDEQLERFLSKVDKTDHDRCKEHGCWIWTGCTIGVGYGQFWLNGKIIRAHRASYGHFKGAIPEGLVVRHLCEYEDGDRENRRCVNPDHLEVGTQRENLHEGFTNATKTHCPKCGGDYILKKNGKRICRPCHNAKQRERERKKRLLN
jgi:formylmethanofuran dehydrogenase subunit E